MYLNGRALQSFREAVEAVVHREHPRWRVVVSEAPRTPARPVRVTLEHPLSNGLGWPATADEVARLDLSFLEKMLRMDLTGELHDIANAPERAPHASLLQRLRLRARDFGWSHLECRVLARILHEECGCLEAPEAAWFANFTGEGAPRVHTEWPPP